MKYDLVIFDLDGTLLNTLGDLTDAANHVLAEAGLPEKTLEDVRLGIGGGVGRLMRKCASEGTSQETLASLLERFKARYAAHVNDRTLPYPGVPELLKALRKAGIHTAINSNEVDAATCKLWKAHFGELIDMAQGEYIIFLDGDDTIVEGSLQRLHDKISARPGADLYPCAIRMYDESTGETLELRDNYPQSATEELNGIEATILAERHCHDHSCPMLQLTVFRRAFLIENGLKCIPGLRRQDSEFSPRALYLSKRVVPLHEIFYLYRIRRGSVGTSARGEGYFYKDWATIMQSLLAFHAKVSREPGFDRRVSECWAVKWLRQIFYFWFAPYNVKTISRARRVETLECMFSGGLDDFDRLLKATSTTRRIAGRWVEAFAKHPSCRAFVELLFRFYFACTHLRHNKNTSGAK